LHITQEIEPCSALNDQKKTAAISHRKGRQTKTLRGKKTLIWLMNNAGPAVNQQNTSLRDNFSAIIKVTQTVKLTGTCFTASLNWLTDRE
jgi:hypothetical protein